MTDTTHDAPMRTPLVELSPRSVLAVLIVGCVVGVFAWLLYTALDIWLITPVLCKEATAATCSTGHVVSYVFALVVVGAAGLVALIRNGAYRPLLIALAAAVSLYGVQAWLQDMAWYEAALWHGLLYAAAYGVFSWLSRVASFGLALVLFVVVVTAARLAISWL